MPPSQKDTSSAGLLIVNGLIAGTLVVLALISRGGPALISESVQAEFVSPDLGSAAPVQLAEPAVHGWTARAN
jgi:hypothetical protein